jgi:hypothetical protein
MLENKIVERAVHILYQSYNTITVEDAFCMAVGDAEIEFNTDIDLKLNADLRNQIIIKSKK